MLTRFEFFFFRSEISADEDASLNPSRRHRQLSSLCSSLSDPSSPRGSVDSAELVVGCDASLMEEEPRSSLQQSSIVASPQLPSAPSPDNPQEAIYKESATLISADGLGSSSAVRGRVQITCLDESSGESISELSHLASFTRLEHLVSQLFTVIVEISFFSRDLSRLITREEIRSSILDEVSRVRFSRPVARCLLFASLTRLSSLDLRRAVSSAGIVSGMNSHLRSESQS